MAASPALRTVPNTPLNNRFAHDEDAIETRLPSGQCNFRNLDATGNPATCGCKRFWHQTTGTIRGVGHIGSQARSGFCMCEHHACYHDEAPEVHPQSLIDSDRADPKNIRPENRIISPRPALSGQGLVLSRASEPSRPPSTLPETLQFNHYLQAGSSLGLPAIPSQCLLPSDNGSMTSSSQARYARPFGGLGLGTLSHLPAPGSGHATNQPPSKSPQPRERRMQVYQDDNGNDFLQSLTEVATPSAQTSQEPTHSQDRKNIAGIQNALEKLIEMRSQGQNEVPSRPMSDGICSAAIKQSASHSEVDLATFACKTDEDENLIPRFRILVNRLSDYLAKVQSHERRLELLENTSFTNPAIDDLQEADDRMETRVSDIEDRVIELEKAHSAMNDASSVGSKQLVNSSFASNASAISSVVGTSALHQIDISRIQSLEARILELQATSLPSYSRPWEVEIVFLPFGLRLTGIWSTQHTSTQRSRQGSTQNHHHTVSSAQVQLLAHDETSSWERLATNTEQEDDFWSIARACGKGSRVDERLRSRGLVKTVKIMGPDARDVQAAMLATFGDLPTVLKADPYSLHEGQSAGAVPERLRGYLGLQSPWIPLRKVHKDSCLRFLNPSEMTTPALWTVPFLTSSVAMRQKDIKRLYVTQSDSYVQHVGTQTADWTWQKLRRLPRVYPDQQSIDHTPEADAHEPCWNFDDRLDPVHESYHSSFASHISSLSLCSPGPNHDDFDPASQSDHFSSAPISPNPSTTPTSVAPTNAFPSLPIKERHPFRPLHTRTISMPSIGPSKPSQPPKRRITSFEQEIHSSPSRTSSTSATNLLVKRRRISRSPSRPLNTPRYSNGPPSPFNHTDEILGKRDEGMTPFAYATPYSNAPYVDQAHPRSGIGIYEDEDEDDPGSATDDMNAEQGQGAEANALGDSDNDEAQYEAYERQLDEEWEGMDDSDDRAMDYESQTGLRREIEDEQASEASSAPSVYPSTQPSRSLYPGSTKTAFKIHVDEEIDGDYL